MSKNIRLFKKHNNTNSNVTNCPCCNKLLDNDDKSQKQHIYPDWCYKLFKKNDKNKVELKAITIGDEIKKENFYEVNLDSQYSNFWCKKCEGISSKLDLKIKDILYGRGKPLVPDLMPFSCEHYKKKTSRKKYKRMSRNKKNLKFFKKDSKVIHRWISSILVRVILNEMPDQTDIVKQLYPLMVNDQFKPFFAVAFDPSEKEFMFSPVIITVNDQFGAINFNFGPFIIFAVFDKQGQPKIGLQIDHRLVYTNVKKKTKIPIIPGSSIQTLKGLFYDLNKYKSHGTIGCMFIDQRINRIGSNLEINEVPI